VRHVGAVLQPADDGPPLQACNGFPRGVADTEQRHAGDGRLIWMEHAERNAIFAAARAGRSTSGARLASSYFPCTDCARAIIQAGIRHLVTLPPDLDDPVWGASFGPSLTMLQEAGVRLHLSRRDAAQAQSATMQPP
jgi:dCMP deaminase